MEIKGATSLRDVHLCNVGETISDACGMRVGRICGLDLKASGKAFSGDGLLDTAFFSRWKGHGQALMGCVGAPRVGWMANVYDDQKADFFLAYMDIFLLLFSLSFPSILANSGHCETGFAWLGLIGISSLAVCWASMDWLGL